MPTKEWFAPDEPLPRFLRDRADDHEARFDDHEPRESMLLLNASILIMTTALIGIAITVSWGNPLKVLADTRPPAVDASSVQPDTAQSPLQATATGAQTRDETSAASNDAGQKQADIGAPSGALLEQFAAWAARQGERAQDERGQAEARLDPVRPMEDAPARVTQNTQAPDTEEPVRSVRRHRVIRPVQNARAEMRSVRKPAARVRRVRPTQVEARPAQDVRAPEQPGQGAPPASFTFWRQ